VNQLQEIIAGATDDGVSTSNLLRKVQVVAHYLKAEDVTKWVRSELNGYPYAEPFPMYRAHLPTPVMGTWAGYFGSSATQLLSAVGLPQEAADGLFHTNMHQPIAELEELAAMPSDLAHSWDPSQVGMYTQWNEEGKGVWMEEMNLINAHRVVTRASIRGVIDTVRNTALDLALNLQTTDADAGTLNGPTVAEPPIAHMVNNFTTHIYGHGTNVALGDGARQSSAVTVNDVEALIAAVRALGVAGADLEELRAAAEAPEGERPAKFKAFMARVA
jgi:hypothetical protein